MGEKYRIVLKDAETDLSKMSWNELWKLAKDTNDESILRQLAEDKNKNIRCVVALNKSTPTDILKKLAKDNNEDVRSGVAENKNTPVEVLRQLANDKYWYVRNIVAKNPNCPLELLKQLADDEGYMVQHYVLTNPNCPEDLLRYVFEEYYDSYEVRSTLAYYANEINTPKDILETLANDEDKGVKKEAQKALGIYKKPSVKGSLSEEIKTPYHSSLPERIVYVRGSYDLPVKVHLIGNVDKAYKSMKNSYYGFGNPNGAYTDVYIQEAINPEDEDIDCYIGYYGTEGFEDDDVYEELIDKNQYKKATSRVRKIANDEGQKIEWFAGTWDDPWSEALGGYEIDSPESFEQ